MKKIFLIICVFSLSIISLKAQTTKVLYFKADLSCCSAKACNSLQNDIYSIINENFDKKVNFEVIKISDSANANLVKKYSAKSQTVIIEKYNKKGKLTESIDISAEVKTFAYNKDKKAFSEKLKTKINL